MFSVLSIMPLKKSASFKITKVTFFSETRKDQKNISRSTDKLRQTYVPGTLSSDIGDAVGNKQYELSGGVSHELLRELRQNKRFQQRQTLQENRLSRSIDCIQDNEIGEPKTTSASVRTLHCDSNFGVVQTSKENDKFKPNEIKSNSLGNISVEELLKSVNDFHKDKIAEPLEGKFPIDDDSVNLRKQPSIRRNRISKTTDFDVRRRKHDFFQSSKNFDIKGVIKIHTSTCNWLINEKEEYVSYENENLYRVNDTKKRRELLKADVTIRLVRYSNSKSTEIELRDSSNFTYILHFNSTKNAKQFMENEKIQSYLTDNKVTIKSTLLRFLGKRSSREILEKKGIYKNEPIFGNTLKEIYSKSEIPVPQFIYDVIRLIEMPENIMSLGLYRTSGNLATIQKIRFDVDNGRLNTLNQYSKDPDVLTGSLKLFFRELKEPLIPYEVCEKLADIVRMDINQVTSKEHQRIKLTLMKYLSESHLATFYVIMAHLIEVVKYKDHNKMDSYNLAICWGPSLIFANSNVYNTQLDSKVFLSSPKDIVSLSHDATRLIDFFIGYFSKYPTELEKRPENTCEKYLSLKRPESKDSIESGDSSTKSFKKSNSNLSLSVDEVIKKATEYIELNLSAEGLYKKPGSSEKTAKILKKLHKKKSNELDKYRNDVYDFCDALKKYLKECSEPLIDGSTVERITIAFGNSQNYLESTTRRDVIATIEKTHKKDSLIYLLRHIGKVLNHQSIHKVPKKEIIEIWANVLNCDKRIHRSHDTFTKFLTIAVEVFNDNLPDLVRSSYNNNGNTQNRNDNMAEVLKDLKYQQERDRNSRYDNIDNVIGEASLLDENTEQTKL